MLRSKIVQLQTGNETLAHDLSLMTTVHNKSLDASGGSVFRIIIDPAMRS
jgi:hypothetical protein